MGVIRDTFRIVENPRPTSTSLATYTPPPPDPGDRQALVASARTIRLDDRGELDRLRRVGMGDKWKKDAWGYYDVVPEVKFGVNVLGDALSKVRPVPAIRNSPDEDPEPLDVNGDQTGLAAAAADALARIQDEGGGHGELLRTEAINLTVPGDCYFVGREMPDGEEKFEIRSSDELVVRDDRVFLMEGEDPSDAGTPLDPESSMFAKIWRSHPRFKSQSDSALRSVLSTCEELLILDRAARAIERSRNNAGILLLPTELGLGPVKRSDEQDDGTPDPEELKFFMDLLRSLTTPIGDEGAASAVVPHLLHGKAEFLEKIRLVSLHRELDDALKDRQESLLRRLARGLPLPSQVVLGMEDVNHWTAWQIDDDSFKSHGEPLTLLCMNGLTQAYFRPAVAAALGRDVRDLSKLVLWYDASKLIQRPSRAEDAKDLYDRIELKGDSLREATGFDDNDKPDDAEVARRIEIERAKAPQRGDGGGNEAPDVAPMPEETGPPDAEEPDAEAAAITAAAPQGERLDRLAAQLSGIDRQLRGRLEALFDAHLKRALERAGARLVQATKPKKHSNIAAVIAHVPARRAAATLGPSITASVASDTDLLAGAFDEAAQPFDNYVAQAQERALGLVPNLSAADRDDVARQQAADRASAWAWARQRLIELAQSRLYNPDPNVPDQGEVDASTAVPFSIVRGAMALAGGSGGAEADARAAAAGIWVNVLDALGVGTGWLMRATFRKKGILTQGYVWEYGAFPRQRPFEPHEELDGVTFTNFDDPVLENPDSWPPTSHFMPGDHDGCICDLTPVMVKVRAA